MLFRGLIHQIYFPSISPAIRHSLEYTQVPASTITIFSVSVSSNKTIFKCEHLNYTAINFLCYKKVWPHKGNTLTWVECLNLLFHFLVNLQVNFHLPLGLSNSESNAITIVKQWLFTIMNSITIVYDQYFSS